MFNLYTNGVEIWKKQYTMMLDGVGSMVNNVSKAKRLRNGSLMVAGQAYEGNCWTRYKALYKDAWWSPISYAYGSNETWDTLGRQGGDDFIYDFTQLIDGKVVFIGKKNSIDDMGGVWAFVTDSTGKNVLWEKQTKIVYSTSDGRAPKPLSVCATSDSGFTVVGEYACVDSIGGMNAFAAHYIPKAPLSISRQSGSKESKQHIKSFVNGSKVTFVIGNQNQLPLSLSNYLSNKQSILSVFNAAGAKVAEVKQVNNCSIVWDCKYVSKGIYFYEFISGHNLLTGTFTIIR